MRQFALRALEVAACATEGPWTIQAAERTGNRMGNRKIVAAEPWRTGPGGPGPWKPFSDVATIHGGKHDQAEANAEFIALARELLPMLARAFLHFTQGHKQNGAILHEDGDGVTARAPFPLPTRLQESAALWFCREIADAVDNLIETMGGVWVGLLPSDRNRPPYRRLISEGRLMRAQVLRVVANLIDPELDQERRKNLGGYCRIDADGIPGCADFYKAIEGIVGEHALDPTDKQVELVVKTFEDRIEGLRQLLGDDSDDTNEDS